MIIEVSVMPHHLHNNHHSYKNTLARRKSSHVVVGPTASPARATASGRVVLIVAISEREKNNHKVEQYLYILCNKVSKAGERPCTVITLIIVKETDHQQLYGIVISKISLILLQKEYIEQFYFEKRSGGGGSEKELLPLIDENNNSERKSFSFYCTDERRWHRQHSTHSDESLLIRKFSWDHCTASWSSAIYTHLCSCCTGAGQHIS